MKASIKVGLAGVAACFGMLGFAGRAQQERAAAPTVLTDTAPAPSDRFPASWYPAAAETTVYTEAIEQGEPYTGTLVTAGHFINPRTHELTTQNQSTMQARDGKGRKRDEEGIPRSDGQGKTVMAHQVSVHDPVSHCTFQWMEPWVAPNVSGPPTATVTCMPLKLRYTNQNIWADALVSEQKEEHSRLDATVSEPLGTRQMQGVAATGVRRTHTTLNPEGAEQTKVVTEVWYSAELKELMSLKITAEAVPGGNRPNAAMPSYELTDIHRGEPDPSLFYPPAGYRIESTLVANH